MDSTQKQPYEMLVLGRTSTEATGVTLQHLPEDKTVISVPCSLHSKKPPLLGTARDIFELPIVAIC